MKNCLSAMVKPLVLSFMAIAIFTLGQSVALADEVRVAGSASGVFGSSGTNISATTPTGLVVYNGSTFDVTTALGIGSIGNAPGVPNFNNLGSITVGTTVPPIGFSDTFSLVLTFTSPLGIDGGQAATYTAIVTGSITTATDGGITFDFDDPLNNPRTFVFTSPDATGTFTLEVNNVSITSGSTAAITGRITGATQTANPIPEPATLLLLGTGLSGIAAGVRRRRKAAKE